MVGLLAILVALVVAVDERPQAEQRSGPLVATTYAVQDPVGLMVTSGGWAYCEQMRQVARRTRHTLLCGRYHKDRYLGLGLRSQRQLDWGNTRYLAQFAKTIATRHRQTGGPLILIGVSYSGFGVATLASHHPELQPDRLIVIDAYFDLAARRLLLPESHETAREIDREVGPSQTALRQRSAAVDGLARLVRDGTKLTVVWSVSDDERNRFRGATCNRDASAATLARLARTLGYPVTGWVTSSKHGGNLWRAGFDIVRGSNPGREVLFPPSGRIPAGSFCAS